MAAPIRNYLPKYCLLHSSRATSNSSRFTFEYKYELSKHRKTVINLVNTHQYSCSTSKNSAHVLSANVGQGSRRKSGGGVGQCSYPVVWRPVQGRGNYSRDHKKMSTGHSPQESSGNVSLGLGIGGFALCSVALAFTFWKEDKKGTIEKMIARAVIAERDNRLSDADSFYHQATVLCEKEKNTQALLYTYDQMANFNMRHGRLMKAENLFKETLRLLLSSGMPKEDPAVVEISLKLSRIYERMGRNDEAETGFNWCIETSEKLLKETPDDSKEERMNLKSLLGMCLDSYARFLGVTNRLAQAEKLYKRALEICEQDLMVDGTPHPQTVVLLNDLGTICDMQGHYDEAVEHISRAIELAENGSPAVLSTVLCNLASIKMHKGLKEESRQLYERALELAEKDGDREATIIIRANLLKVL